MPKTPTDSRRSDCPVACTLDILGDRWTLLVVRDMLMGKRRYKEFADSPEGIPTNILAERLKRLVEWEVAEKITPEDRPRAHPEYQLTAKGQDLALVIRSMVRWGRRHVDGSRVPEDYGRDADS